MTIEGVRAFADAMANVGAAVDARYERMCVEYVFGLTGGELDDEPLKFKGPGAITGRELDFSWRYHYDGVPEWCESDFDDRHDSEVQYFTLVEIGCSYGSSAPEELTLPNGDRYFKVAQYVHSGETECPMGSCGDDETVGEESTEGMRRCPLCDEEAGEKHGYIYVGNGCETVYKRVDFSCAECHIMKSELTADAPACDCEE